MKAWTTVLGVASLACLPLAAEAQDAATDQLKKELTEQKELLNLQKDVITGQKDVLDAQLQLLQKKLPALPEGKTGAVTIESGTGDSLHATMQAYKALAGAAAQICKLVQKKGDDKRIAILNEDDLRLAAQYRIIISQIETLQRDYARALGKVGPAGVPLAGIGPVLSTLVDLTKLFRTDRKLFFAPVTSDDVALTDQLAACLQTALPGKVLYARVQTSNAIGFGAGDFARRLRALAQDDVELTAAIKAREDAPPKGDDAKKGASGTTDEVRKKKEMAELLEWKALSERYKTFQKSLEGTDTTNKQGLLLSALQGEAVHRMLSCNGTVCADPGKSDEEQSKLHAKLLTTRVVAAGGTTMVTSSLFRSDRMYSSGGAVVTFRLTDGSVVQLADSVSIDSELEEIQKLPAK